ncbi:hypothetical protein JCM5350_002282 [Sporobolomyces pararoseus]
MSFSSLPPELVHQIIESTVPPTLHSTTYDECQRTLCRLSLVSRLCRSIAQPLLLRVVRLTGVEELEKLPESRASKTGDVGAQSIRWLVIQWDLTYLQLRSQYSVTCDGIYLPNLRDLTLHAVSSELFSTLANPATAPNLRNLSLFNCDVTQSIFQQLLPQLKTLTLDANTRSTASAASLHSAASRTLVHFDLCTFDRFYSSFENLQHVRLCASIHPSQEPENWFQARLDRWSTFIRNNLSLPLKSIYLDFSLHPSKSFSSATRHCLESFIRVCEERKIDLIFETGPINVSIDPFISREFVRRQEEFKRELGEEEGERGLSAK